MSGMIIIWLTLPVMAVAGAIGGVVNALISDNGFLAPCWEQNGDERIWRPGVAGNMLTGAVGAVVSWGLYGPFAALDIVGGPAARIDPGAGLTLSALVGGILVGVGGARWLTSEVDKRLLRAAAVSAAQAGPAPELANKLALRQPASALCAANAERAC